MATHFSVLAWRIPGTGEPDGLSHRVRHDWSDLAAAAFILYNIYVLALYSFIYKGRKKKTGAVTKGCTAATTLSS